MSEEKKWKFDLREKHTWLLFGLVGLLLLVLALPTEETKQADVTETDARQEQTAEAAASAVQSETEALEQRLEQTLSLIDGAGRVRVMLTFKDAGEKVIEKDRAHRTGTTDTAETSESTVFARDGSTETPYISNELTPQVEGVLVVAQGGGNSLVKQNILQSVMALFPLEAHKITIVKMSMQEVSEHENF